MKILYGIGWAIVFAVLVAVAMKALDRPNDIRIAAARDTMRTITVQRDTVRDTIRVREQARAHWDTVVRNVSDTQVVIQREKPDTVTVPVEVIRRDQSKDSLLSGFYTDRRLDSLWHIQDAKLPHSPPSRWGYGFAAGPSCSNKGCGLGVTFGVTWRP